MRIISGIRRGHKLLEFEGDDVRPTTDRVKESVFNLIQSFVPDAVCLDMFAGSGALSFEAVSRGAKRAVCIDIDRRSIDIIKKNADSLGFSDKCEIVNMSCFDYAERTQEKFDIIFLDPPYNKDFIVPVLKSITGNDILSENGIVVLESDGPDFHDEIDGLDIYRQRKYGRTYITVYRKQIDTALRED
jgi:16S rRNA (guanine(966)-N(2))-methyltransferase RsmD